MVPRHEAVMNFKQRIIIVDLIRGSFARPRSGFVRPRKAGSAKLEYGIVDKGGL